MSQSLEDLFKFVIEAHPEKVQVLNGVETKPINGKHEHAFIVTVKIESEGKTESFRLESGKVVADHELREDVKESTPEYDAFQRTLLSMFHKVNIIDRRLQLIRQTKLPKLRVEVQP